MQVKPGDIVGTVICPDCGDETPVKVSRSHTLFIFCRAIIGETASGKPERCWHREFWGRDKSRKIIEEFEQLSTEKEIVNADQLQQQEIGSATPGPKIDPEPSPAPARKSKWWDKPIFAGGDSQGA